MSSKYAKEFFLDEIRGICLAYFVDWVCFVLPFGKKRTPTGCYYDAFNRTEEEMHSFGFVTVLSG